MLRVLGAGGMGVVLQAEDTVLTLACEGKANREVRRRVDAKPENVCDVISRWRHAKAAAVTRHSKRSLPACSRWMTRLICHPCTER